MATYTNGQNSFSDRPTVDSVERLRKLAKDTPIGSELPDAGAAQSVGKSQAISREGAAGGGGSDGAPPPVTCASGVYTSTDGLFVIDLG